MSANAKIIFILCISAMISCRSNKSQSISTSAENAVVTFVDSTAAAKAIIEDDVDGFFDNISIIDMAIQLKTEKPFATREEALKEYKSYLQTEVMNWTDTEKILMNEIFDSIQAQVVRVNPKLMPEDIRLVKIRTTHYGPDVYYTRGHNIMIPENALTRQGAREMLEPVMIHEVFHLISRYDKPLREKIYGLIGFFPHNVELDIPTTLTDGMMPGFFEQIKDNTQYIIHPDEIAADNFIYAVTRSNIEDPKRFSEEGNALVNKIYKVLKEN